MKKKYNNEAMISLLQEYLRIKTVHPHADYKKVIDLFFAYANGLSLKREVVFLDSDFPMSFFTLVGKDPSLPGLLLSHHMDTVPASSDEWLFDPHGGFIQDGYIYGRGVQDMKGIGIQHFAALVELCCEGFVPSRSVYFASFPGEECGGFDGAGNFIKTDFFASLNIGYVLDEGVASGQQGVILLATDEKRPLQIQIISNGKAAHASILMAENPVHRLCNVLKEIAILHTSSFESMLKGVDTQFLTSYHITSLMAGNMSTVNIIPSSAQAIIDIRISPGVSMQKIIDIIEAIINRFESVSYKILACALEENHYHGNSILYNTCSEVLKEHAYQVKSIVFEGASDMRFYRNLGLEAVGCSPLDEHPLLHATNERLSIAGLIKGKDIFKDIIKKFCQ